MRFKFTRPYAGDLANGRPLAPGDVVDLTPAERAANRRLIDAGQLVPVPARAVRRRSTRTRKR